MALPTVYFVRHGETDWNVAGRLQGHRDIPLNDKGRVQAAHCGTILKGLFAKEGRDPHSIYYTSSPMQRATETMELARTAMGLPERGYIRDPRLIEIAFGDWEGSTIALLHQNDPVKISQREHDKWHFLPPGGESYEMCSQRMKSWYDSLDTDVVAVSHGGTCRGLMACLGIAKPAVAPLIDIIQGEVYVFQGDKLERFA